MAIVTGGYAGIARVELVPMDLADPRSVDAFSETFLASKRPLHLLVNNAGIMAAPLARDARGFGVVDGRAPALNGSNLRAPLEGR